MTTVTCRRVQRSSTRRLAALAGLGVFAVLRIGSAVRAPHFEPDSPSYLNLNFLGRATRFWTIPLVYRLLANDAAREVFQVTVAVAAWSALAVAVARSLQDSRVRLIAVTIVALLGLAPMVTIWDAVLMSESISISLMVVLIAGGLELRRSSQPWLLAGMVGVACLWVFARQANVFVYVVLLPVAVVVAWRRLPRRSAIVLTTTLILIAGWGAYDMEVGQQQGSGRFVTIYNAAEITVYRPVVARYFEAHGMPSQALVPRRHRDDHALFRLFSNAAFERWATARFQPTFANYVITHPRQTLGAPLGRLFRDVSLPPPHIYTPARTLVPTWVTGIVWSTRTDLGLWVGLVLAGVLLVTCRARVEHALVLLGLLAATVVMAVMTYDLATEDYGRLFTPIGVNVRLLLLLTIALSADALAARRRLPIP